MVQHEWIVNCNKTLNFYWNALLSLFIFSGISSLIFLLTPYLLFACLAAFSEEKMVVLRDTIIDIGVSPGGNKTPPSISPENLYSSLLLYDCRRSFRESEDRSIRKHKSPVRSSAIYRLPLERSLSVYGLSGFFLSTYFIFLRWTPYNFFSIPLKDRSVMSDRQSARSTL